MVDVYYNVPSKHHKSSYLTWMRHFLTLQDCMLIITSQSNIDYRREERQANGLDSRTVIVGMDLTDLPITQLYANNPQFWQDQLDIDPEADHHKSYQLFLDMAQQVVACSARHTAQPVPVNIVLLH
jgi:hypothetical protein